MKIQTFWKGKKLISHWHIRHLSSNVSFCTNFFRCDNQYVIKGIKKECFSSILEYFYTGAISIEEANVFDILETCHFLQINNDPLLAQCTKWMIQRLDPLKLIDVMLLAKVRYDREIS